MDSKITDIYMKQIIGNSPRKEIPKQLNRLYEDVELYVRDGDGYKLLGDVSDDNFKKINRIASGGNARQQIEQYLNQKKYESTSFGGEDDFTNLVDMLDNGEFENYIKVKKPNLSENTTGNMIGVASEKGFDTNMAARIARFKPVDDGGSNVGPGEILIALIFDDVTNATGGGDLSINGEKLEVKGQLGRFGQQGSRGGVKFSAEPLFEGLSNPVKQVPSLEGNIMMAYNAFKAENKEDLFLENLHKLLEQVYAGGAVDKYFPATLDYTSGTSRSAGADHSPIRKALGKLNLQQYSSKYNLTNLIFVKGTDRKTKTSGKLGDYAAFTVDDAIKEGGLIDQGKLKSKAISSSSLYPNFEYMFT
tara:strand:- start:142 stop:1227 length:1086 start_codon:yes stop_codon:yes gene_type:complete